MLPESLKEIAEIIGTGAAINLARDFGGGEMYIPKTMTKDHDIAQCIGLDAATKLSTWANGDTLDIPRAVGYKRGQVYAEIKEDVAGGMSKKKAARKHQLTTRWVRKICNEQPEEDPNQGKLL